MAATSFTPVKLGPYVSVTTFQDHRVNLVRITTCADSGGGEGGSARPTSGMLYPRGTG